MTRPTRDDPSSWELGLLLTGNPYWDDSPLGRAIQRRHAVMSDSKPTYEELILLLRDAPPRQMVEDQRYWDWRKKVEALLARVEE